MSQNARCEEEAKPFLHEDQSEPAYLVAPRKNGHRNLVILPWLVAAVSWLVTIYLILAQRGLLSRTVTCGGNSTQLFDHEPYNASFPTDFKALQPSIAYETRVFTGALYYDMSTKRFIRNATVDGPEYFGPPSDAIDAAWDALIDPEWIPMTDEESLSYRPRLKTFNGFYRFEPDMFHSLHCINEIRKRIDLEYYLNSEHEGIKIEQEDWDRIHIDHCLDQIRQSIMCFGDLSPVPLYSWEGAPLGIGQGTAHTCRKWDPVRQWANQRRLEMNDQT